jgi:uncharacterized protein
VAQAKLLDFMSCTEAYDPVPATVECIETHASYIFLAGDFAYKVKRAVKYPFLDFSTLGKRHAACLNELRLNRRTAPQLYLEVMPVSEGGNGELRLGGHNRPIEWVLKMRRFPQEMLLDRMAGDRRLPLDIMGPLAAAIAGLHARADRILDEKQAVAPLRSIIAEHEGVLAQNPAVFPPDAAQDVVRLTRQAFDDLSELLRKRARGGYVRHGHGDLHLRNIVSLDNQPVLFDALEFDDDLATIDVLYDVAFLLMDLGKRGLVTHANGVLNAYLDAGDTGNLLGLAALPLFLSLRAMIRAKVELLRAQAASSEEGALEDVHAYFDLARNFLAPAPPQLIAIGGLSGSGKSAIAREIAPGLGAFPGAVIIRSDMERKRLFGVPPEARLPQDAYTQSVSDRVYAICRKRAALALEAGRVVIIDAVHAKPAEREAVEALAAAQGAAFTGLWLDVPAEVMRARVGKRTGDVSDATPDVVDAQRAYDLGEMDFHTIDARGAVEEVAARCRDLLVR